MRGKVIVLNIEPCPSRITPAYAGKSAVRRGSDFAEQDHPRLCGEKHVGMCQGSSMTGSPPPMRGKAYISLIAASMIRITPAYAGKSYSFLQRKFFVQDHPRLCGEKSTP